MRRACAGESGPGRPQPVSTLGILRVLSKDLPPALLVLPSSESVTTDQARARIALPTPISRPQASHNDIGV